jgi:hypothetical protein
MSARYQPGEEVPQSIATYRTGLRKNALKPGFSARSDGKYFVSTIEPPKTLPLKTKRKGTKVKTVTIRRSSHILPKEKKATMALDKCSPGKKRVGGVTTVSKVKRCVAPKKGTKRKTAASKTPKPKPAAPKTPKTPKTETKRKPAARVGTKRKTAPPKRKAAPPKPPGREKLPKLDVLKSLAAGEPMPIKPPPKSKAVLDRLQAARKKASQKSREKEIALARAAFSEGGL